MRIQYNKSASSAMRSVLSHRSALAKSLEKLSSGYTINRSADDAAGLAISEKMRRQITGLEQANQNSKDGVTLIQVGEGALSEVHDMLNRALELADQSANGIYNDELDREALQRELDQLLADIDRIAQSTNFNGIELFQDKGLKFETPDSYYAITGQTRPDGGAGQTSGQPVQDAQTATQTAPVFSRNALDALLKEEDKGELNIVYIEDPMSASDQKPLTKPDEGIEASDPAQDITMPSGEKISDILKTQIVPQTVENILTNYPAFSYLKDSAIGIGMRLYSDPTSSVLASVTVRPLYYPNNGTGTLGYMLSVNMGQVNPADANWREDLEATIAHEMIHAFMDEATTAGMTGLVMQPGAGSVQDVGRFEKWFIEGMAQTASGHNGWIYPKGYTGDGLSIEATSTDAEIQAQISNRRLTATSTDSGVNYGTGYLACMYLGWAIASGGNTATAVTAGNISAGLNALLSEVIGGSSLDAAISKLTNNNANNTKFASTADFRNKFNAAGTEVTGFIRNLMSAIGTGRGGLASGDLTATNLTDDAALNNVGLFALNTTTPMVNNEYPSDYVILTGGATSIGGVAPSDFGQSASSVDYGDFVITGGLPDGSGGIQGVAWDAANKTLTVDSSSDVKITLKSGTTGTDRKLVLTGAGKATLSGVAADSIQVGGNTTAVAYEGKNEIGTVTVDSGRTVDFQGEGQLKANTFTNNGDVTFSGGAVIVGGGTGAIGGTVKVNGASVAAAITTPTSPAGAALKSIDVDWSELTGLSDIASISIDSTSSGALLDSTDPGRLWLDPAKTSYRVSFSDKNGISKTLMATYDGTNFTWTAAAEPFTLNNDAVYGRDYEYKDNGATLVIKSNKVTSISGGSIVDSSGTTIKGRIEIANGVGDVNLTLDGVDCSGNAVKSGFDLGTDNTVTLTLANGKENKFKGAANYAGISVGAGTKLTINGDTGKLTATGGTNAAGIGRNASAAASGGTGDKTSSITINGGEITATGDTGGAGIGAGDRNDFGDITITGGNIKATGGSGGGAGIGGANYADCGDILINEASGKTTTIVAISNGHGAGIGGGWYDTVNGTITISAGDITAKSETHGTGIGAGCQGGSSPTYHSECGKITINGTALIREAIGGNQSAGIGSSRLGTCAGLEISGDAVIMKAQGGTDGAGIGSGEGSHMGDIIINTTGQVHAAGGVNGVGIGSGYGSSTSSTVGDIVIKKGIVEAVGGTNSTGIGAGRNSTSGNVTIGDASNPNNEVIVTAKGGMSYNGGNIMAYGDKDHTEPGTVIITGNGTTVRPGEQGEGLYSTSGVSGADGRPRYAYPVYLFHTDKNSGNDATLNAGVGLNAASSGKLPLNKDKIDLSSIKITSDKGGTWTTGLSHDPLDSDYVFVWLRPRNQTLTIEYKEKSGAAREVKLDLIYYPESGVFRIQNQPKPEEAVPPGYDGKPGDMPPPLPDWDPEPPDPEPEEKPGGIILQIGAEYGEILTVPQFYFSVDALNLGNLDISTQENAWESVPVIQNAINRVSSIRGTYGALQNRLEHNQRQLQYAVENTTDAESRIRDTDMAKEMMAYTKSNILLQSAQAMLAQANQVPQGVLQLLS